MWRALFLIALAGTQVDGFAMSPSSRVLSRPMLAKRIAPATFTMEEPAPAKEGADPALDPTCIEDESIEECTVLSWPAGKITVRKLTHACSVGGVHSLPHRLCASEEMSLCLLLGC